MFGVMALVYTVTVIGVVLFFWQSRVSGVLDYFGGWVFWLLIGLIMAVIGIPVTLALAVLGYKVGQQVKAWAYQNVFQGRPGHQVAGLGVLAVIVALPALLLSTGGDPDVIFGATVSDIYILIAGILVLGAGLVFSTRVAPWYLGSRLQWFFLTLPLLLVLLLFAQVLRLFGGAAGTAAGVIAFGVVPVLLIVSLAYLYPTVISFTRTVLQGAWALVASGAAFIVAGALIAVLTSGEGAETYAHALGLVGYVALTAGMFRIQHRLRLLRPQQSTGFVSEAISDAERLSSAIRFVVESTTEQFVQIYGRRALNTLEEQFNAAATVGTGWGFSLSNGRMVSEANGDGSLLDRSQTYATALSHLFFINSRISGSRFVDRQLRSLYRLMPWEERAIGDEYLFFRLDWTAGVHRAFKGAGGSHFSLLRSAPLFARLGEDEIKVISDRLHAEKLSQEQRHHQAGRAWKKILHH